MAPNVPSTPPSDPQTPSSTAPSSAPPRTLPSLLLDLLFPKSCVSCGAWGSYMCPTCRQKIHLFDFSLCPVCDRPTLGGRTHEVCRSPEGLDGFIPIVQYAKPVSTLIKNIKYAGVSDAAEEVYTLFTHHWPGYAPTFDMLVPIPLHPNKKRLRGFNQAELFARQIAASKGFPVRTDVLIKQHETVSQASLKLKQRKSRTDLGFVCLNNKSVHLSIIGLVDDVATTRSTLAAACKILKNSGAKEVWGIVLAHTY